MPPKKLPPKMPQQSKQQGQGQKVPKNDFKSATTTTSEKPAIPEQEVKQSSSISAQLALEAAKKAYELRQAAYGAGDPNAREEILAKAINKEIEAETFGKAAKYTRSGAFQGLAAGAGLGVQPGAFLGKLTGAIVGGLLSSVGAVVGGGVGSAYGAISGPFWDLGEMASHGVRSIVGDFPNWDATPSQKKALEKMVIGARQTQSPSQEELEDMRDDDGGGMSQEDYQQFTQNLTSWIPNMPSMPSMSSMPSISSITGLGRKPTPKTPAAARHSNATAAKSNQNSQSKASASSQQQSKPKGASPTATSQANKSQPTPMANETVVKKRPKKLEVRSKSTTSQPNGPAVRRTPPKLGAQQKSGTSNT